MIIPWKILYVISVKIKWKYKGRPYLEEGENTGTVHLGGACKSPAAYISTLSSSLLKSQNSLVLVVINEKEKRGERPTYALPQPS